MNMTSTLSRIKPTRHPPVPLPFPPALATFVDKTVVLREEVLRFDIAQKKWWEKVHIALENWKLSGTTIQTSTVETGAQGAQGFIGSQGAQGDQGAAGTQGGLGGNIDGGSPGSLY